MSSAMTLLSTDVWDNVKPTGDSLVNLVSQASRDVVTACSLTLVHGQGQSFSEFWWVRYQAALCSSSSENAGILDADFLVAND